MHLCVKLNSKYTTTNAYTLPYAKVKMFLTNLWIYSIIEIYSYLCGHKLCMLASHYLFLLQKNGWFTTRSSLCFELEQIRDHFYYTNFLFFYNKSGLRFAVTQSITMVTFYSNPAVFWKNLLQVCICNVIMLWAWANLRPLLL